MLVVESAIEHTMGSSFTEFRGHGFWCRDEGIELWLLLLAREIDKTSVAPEWLKGAAQNWRTQATAGFNGFVAASLDDYASTPDRQRVIIELTERAMEWLRMQGRILPADVLNSFGLNGRGSYFTDDVPANVFLPVGTAIIRLLRGELAWDVSTSPVLCSAPFRDNPPAGWHDAEL